MSQQLRTIATVVALSTTLLAAGPARSQRAAADAPRPATAAPPQAVREVMYMVSRWHVPNVSSLVTPELDRAHKDHIKEFSVSVTSANMLDPQGKVIGVVSIKGFSSLEQANRYVYGDPFTKAGLYTKIEIQPIDLYVLNGAFARAPEWVIAERPEERYKYTPATPKGKDCP
jgi:uncharacterized protein YciI